MASPQPLSDDPLVARRLLDLVGSLPTPVWGRDELGTGEMWNSNSVIAWLLARSGLPAGAGSGNGPIPAQRSSSQHVPIPACGRR